MVIPATRTFLFSTTAFNQKNDRKNNGKYANEIGEVIGIKSETSQKSYK